MIETINDHLKYMQGPLLLIIAHAGATIPTGARPSGAYFINTLRPRQNGRQIPDDSFKWIFLKENV